MTGPSSSGFSITDKRSGGRIPAATSSLITGNLTTEMSRLRAQGLTGPRSAALARNEAVRIENAVKTDGSLGQSYVASVRAQNRAATAEMNRSRLASQRITGMGGSNLEIAYPKMRKPMSTLIDKGIPFDVESNSSLQQIRSWCRLFYTTHDLIPLLIDIYSKFPCVGIEFDSKDPEIKEFYETLFFDTLNYNEFLTDSLGREYYTCGEVTSFAHFSESLGAWSSEEILNPDLLNVSKVMFTKNERVQLRVKEIVEALQNGPQGVSGTNSVEETPSERLERLEELKTLQKYYPEFIAASANDDGLDLSDALVSRIVNRSSDWHLRGTPIMLRSFKTLMLEESLNAAQDAVADRLYSPFILATLGIEDLGDGTPWIPTEEQLSEARSDFQSALMGDFRLMVHNFGLKIESVFGRESVPRFDQDFTRVDEKILQAWGIGKALISGGTASAGTYASTALNREFVTQMMVSFQNQIRNHFKRRMELVAEAQGHFDYDKKGSIKRPKYRDVLEVDEETGEERVVKVPKFLIPEVKFRTLNLRDEAQEREFLTQLRDMGVPISDKTLSVNIDVDFQSELDRVADETVQKGYAEAQAMKRLQMLCDRDGLPYPQVLAEYLNNTLMLRQQKANTEGTEGQVEMQEKQMDMMSPAGMMGVLPSPPGSEGDDDANGPVSGPTQGDQGPPLSLVGAFEAKPPHANPPHANPPHADAPGTSGNGQAPRFKEVPRNRVHPETRPEESDELRGEEPRQANRSDRFKKGPSSYKYSRRLSQEEVLHHIERREKTAEHTPRDDLESLVFDDSFWDIVNMSQYSSEVRADWSEIRAGNKSLPSYSHLKEALEIYEEMFDIFVAV